MNHLTVPLLIEIADECHRLIHHAERAGITIDDGNVVDLCANNLNPDISLSDIRCALVVAGLSARFPSATSRKEYFNG